MQSASFRHCERSEAIHRATQRKNGLLRCARNDGETHLRDLAAGFARGLASSFRPPRLEGAGNAGRPMRPITARAMVVVERTRVSQVTPANTRHSPRNGLRLTSCSSRRSGFFVTVIPEKLASHELDASVEASEPHDLAVRLRRIRQSAIRVHHIPPRVRDDRDTPLEWGETEQVIKVICVFGKSEYFLKGAGQTPNQQTEEIC